jgi:hypothetical protein
VTLVDTYNMMEMTIYIILYIYCYMSVINILLYVLLYLICYIPVNHYNFFSKKHSCGVQKKRISGIHVSGVQVCTPLLRYTPEAYKSVRHGYKTHPWRTHLYATGRCRSSGVQACTPWVGELAVAYSLYAIGSPVPVAPYPWRTAVRHG